jgi:hypothetical protein
MLGLALILVATAAIMSPGFRSDVAYVAGDMSSFLPELSESSPWDDAIQTPDGGRIGVVTANALNVRDEPSLDAAAIDSMFDAHLVTVYDTVSGDEVDGESDWYLIDDDQYITAAYVEPFEPREPDSIHEGRWVDIDLTEQYAVAWQDDTPVYAAILLTGRAGWDTPEGAFEIIRRVESETMDASTVGIDEDAPNYYYLEDVPHVQYFAEGGYAIHGNDWSPPEAFGDTGSHGCINMQVEDARFFWEFLEEGSPVNIAY